MKTVLFVGCLLLAGCAAKECADLTLLHHFNALELERNRKLLIRVKERFSNPANERIKNETSESLRVASLHLPYLKSKSRTDLLTYADSMYSVLDRSNYRNDSIKQEIADSREIVKNQGDSSGVLNLFFWSITAENIVLEERLARVSVISDSFVATLPSFLEKDVFKVGDTVSVSFQFFPEYNLDFKQLVCADTSGENSLTPDILKVGPAYILSYRPQKPGNYVITGMVGVGGDFVYGMRVHNRFTVQ